ncbi:MAG: FG-GAP-like repeat-containing protein [Xanthobacteraceae bacterium]
MTAPTYRAAQKVTSRVFLSVATVISSLLLVGDLRAQPGPTLWITGPLVKVHQDAAAGTAQSLQIAAAKNEFESFQVHVRAGTSAVSQLGVTVSDLTSSRDPAVQIASATNIFVHRAAYLNITTLSDQNGASGPTPDPLIPQTDPYFNQARNAFPVAVAPGTVQSAWIDVLVPPSAASDYYSGTVTVTDGATVLGQLSITVKVWNFALPSTASLKSAFGLSWNGLCIQAYGIGTDNGYTNCAQYPGSGGSSETALHSSHVSQARFFLDHRVSISDVVYPPTSWPQFDSFYGPLLDGTAATLLPQAKLRTLRYAAPGYRLDDIADWVAHFSAKGWLETLYDYTCDEPPNGCTWQQALDRAKAVHTASSAMKTLVTTNIELASQNPSPGDNLLAQLDIIVPIVNDMDPQGGTNQRAAYDGWLGTAGKHLWWYEACPSHGCYIVGPTSSTWPSYMIDATPVRNRVFQWLAFANRIESELYFATDYCWTPHSGRDACGDPDPWVSVYAFGGNGDGTLMYPGTPARIGGTTPIPVSSIRLKYLRDGMEDFEYLSALSRNGDDAFARATAATFITNAYTFDNSSQALASARDALGDRLHRANVPPCPQRAWLLCSHDFNGDGGSDIAWRHDGGASAIWLLDGAQVAQSGIFGTVPNNWQIVAQRDFDGDGKSDWLWRDSTTGTIAIWLLNGLQVAQSGTLGAVGSTWTIAGTGDFNGDGKGDILWRETNSGAVAVWLLNGVQIAQAGSLGAVSPTWVIAGVGDFDGDGKADILWRDNTTGTVAIWTLNGLQVAQSATLGAVTNDWLIVGTGDFNADGKSDLLWRNNSTGAVAIWLQNGFQVAQAGVLGNVALDWVIAQTGDFNHDGNTDLLWRNGSGTVALWFLSGLQIASATIVGTVGVDWTIQALNAD